MCLSIVHSVDYLPGYPYSPRSAIKSVMGPGFKTFESLLFCEGLRNSVSIDELDLYWDDQ